MKKLIIEDMDKIIINGDLVELWYKSITGNKASIRGLTKWGKNIHSLFSETLVINAYNEYPELILVEDVFDFKLLKRCSA